MSVPTKFKNSKSSLPISLKFIDFVGFDYAHILYTFSMSITL